MHFLIQECWDLFSLDFRTLFHVFIIADLLEKTIPRALNEYANILILVRIQPVTAIW